MDNMQVQTYNTKLANTQTKNNSAVTSPNSDNLFKTKSSLSRDTLELSTVQNQKTNSKKKKILIALGVVAGATALVVGGILLHKKISTPKLKQLAEHIDFKEADNLDDAIAFGKQHLGIKKYKGFQSTDLDVVNWVNEGLVNVNNKAKGKAIMPRNVQFVESFKSGADAGMTPDGILSISKKNINKYRNTLKTMLKGIPDSPKKQEIIKKCAKNYKNTTNIVMHEIYKHASPEAIRADGTVCSTFGTIYHEMGHLQHVSALGNTEKFLSLGKPKERPDKLADGAQELLDLFKSKENVAASVSGYAKESPLEFVAECYSVMCAGGKLPQETLDLYQKLGGVMI